MVKRNTAWKPARIRRLRRQFRETQEAFARRVGVTFVTLSRWENGHSAPTGLSVRRLETLERERW